MCFHTPGPRLFPLIICFTKLLFFPVWVPPATTPSSFVAPSTLCYRACGWRWELGASLAQRLDCSGSSSPQGKHNGACVEYMCQLWYSLIMLAICFSTGELAVMEGVQGAGAVQANSLWKQQWGKPWSRVTPDGVSGSCPVSGQGHCFACLCSLQFHRAGRAAPRPGLPAAPPLPAPCRRLTRTGTCSPRPRAIRWFVGLLSGAQVAPAALTPALPHARGRLRAQPAETAGSSVTVRAAPRRGHAPGLASTSRCGSAPGTLTSGCGLARTSENGPAPSLVLTSRPGPALDLSRNSGLASFSGCDGSQS